MVCLALVLWLGAAEEGQALQVTAQLDVRSAAVETHFATLRSTATLSQTAKSYSSSQPELTSQQDNEAPSAMQMVHLHHADLTDATLVGRNLTGSHLFTAPLSTDVTDIAQTLP